MKNFNRPLFIATGIVVVTGTILALFGVQLRDWAWNAGTSFGNFITGH